MALPAKARWDAKRIFTPRNMVLTGVIGFVVCAAIGLPAKEAGLRWLSAPLGLLLPLFLLLLIGGVILWITNQTVANKLVKCVRLGCDGVMNPFEVVRAEACPFCKNTGTLIYSRREGKVTCTRCYHRLETPLPCPKCGIDLGPASLRILH